MGIARYYDASKNPDGAQIFGVPLGDLTEEEFDALPTHLQRSVDTVGFYRKTRPPTGEPTKRALPRRISAKHEPPNAETHFSPPIKLDNEPGAEPASTEEG